MFRFAIATVAVTALIAAAAPRNAHAQAGATYPTALAACEANAKKAKDSPTSYACDWRAVVKGAPGFALTGRYQARDKNFSGTLTVIESGLGLALVGIETVFKTSKRQCTVQATGMRGADDVLTVKPLAGSACTIRLISSGPNIVTLKADKCQDQCGMGATFEGRFRLKQ